MGHKNSNVRFDFSRNPELQEVFSRWTPGSNYRVEVEFQLLAQDQDGADGRLVEILVPETEETAEKTVEPDTEQPVMVVMRAGSGDESEGE